MKFLKKLRKICFFLSYKILRKLRSIFNIDQKIYINGNKLVLPPKHLLTLYNKLYPNYDKFLEKLIRNRQNLNIIDIYLATVLNSNELISFKSQYSMTD